MNENQNNMIPEKSEVKHIFAQADSDHLAQIQIVGVGGAGGTAVTRMVKRHTQGVTIIWPMRKLPSLCRRPKIWGPEPSRKSVARR